MSLRRLGYPATVIVSTEMNEIALPLATYQSSLPWNGWLTDKLLDWKSNA
jgi:hypothetical protein